MRNESLDHRRRFVVPSQQQVEDPPRWTQPEVSGLVRWFDGTLECAYYRQHIAVCPPGRIFDLLYWFIPRSYLAIGR